MTKVVCLNLKADRLLWTAIGWGMCSTFSAKGTSTCLGLKLTDFPGGMVRMKLAPHEHAFSPSGTSSPQASHFLPPGSVTSLVSYLTRLTVFGFSGFTAHRR